MCRRLHPISGLKCPLNWSEIGSRFALFKIHSSDEPDKVAQRLCRDDSVVNIVPDITCFTVIITRNNYRHFAIRPSPVTPPKLKGQN